MPAISIRGTEMPASPIRKLAPLADAAKQRGVHVFHLNIGQPDLPTPQVAIDAIRNIDRKCWNTVQVPDIVVIARSWWDTIRSLIQSYCRRYNHNFRRFGGCTFFVSLLLESGG